MDGLHRHNELLDTTHTYTVLQTKLYSVHCTLHCTVHCTLLLFVPRHSCGWMRGLILRRTPPSRSPVNWTYSLYWTEEYSEHYIVHCKVQYLHKLKVPGLAGQITKEHFSSSSSISLLTTHHEEKVKWRELHFKGSWIVSLILYYLYLFVFIPPPSPESYTLLEDKKRRLSKLDSHFKATYSFQQTFDWRDQHSWCTLLYTIKPTLLQTILYNIVKAAHCTMYLIRHSFSLKMCSAMIDQNA